MIQIPKIPPWIISTPKVILTQFKLHKTKIRLLIFQKNKKKLEINILDIHASLWIDLSRRKQKDVLRYTIKND